MVAGAQTDNGTDDGILLSAKGFSTWVDTNVMLDVSSDYQAVKNEPGGAHAVEETRMCMQRAHWLGLALDEQNARTISFQHETMNNLAHYAPPDSDGASFVSAFAWIVKDYVFPKWDAHMTKSGLTIADGGSERETTNDERDQFMVNESKTHGLSVITRDRGARKRALAAGVPVFGPEEYAARVMPFQQAGDRFFERLEIGVREWLKRNGDRAYNRKAMGVLWEIFNAIWAPAGAFFE